VRPDRRVRFRLRAPKATELTLGMDYMPPGRPSEGARVFKVWRLYLSEFAPLLFR
jgi:hypothetical protein